MRSDCVAHPTGIDQKLFQRLSRLLPYRSRRDLRLLIWLLRVPLCTPQGCDDGRPVCCSNICSVARMNCVVEIDASENGEDISLEDGDEQFECGQRDRHHERQWRDDREGAGPKQAHDETAHHLERDVSGEYIGEETNRQGDGSGKARNTFAWHEKG